MAETGAHTVHRVLVRVAAAHHAAHAEARSGAAMHRDGPPAELPAPEPRVIVKAARRGR